MASSGGGFIIQTRMTVSKTLTDPLGLGEMIYSTGDFQWGVHHDISTLWYPMVNPATGDWELSAEYNLTGKDRDGNLTFTSEFDTGYWALSGENGTPVVIFDIAGSTLNLGFHTAHNNNGPTYIWTPLNPTVHNAHGASTDTNPTNGADIITTTSFSFSQGNGDLGHARAPFRFHFTQEDAKVTFDTIGIGRLYSVVEPGTSAAVTAMSHHQSMNSYGLGTGCRVYYDSFSEHNITGARLTTRLDDTSVLSRKGALHFDISLWPPRLPTASRIVPAYAKIVATIESMLTGKKITGYVEFTPANNKYSYLLVGKCFVFFEEDSFTEAELAGQINIHWVDEGSYALMDSTVTVPDKGTYTDPAYYPFLLFGSMGIVDLSTEEFPANSLDFFPIGRELTMWENPQMFDKIHHITMRGSDLNYFNFNQQLLNADYDVEMTGDHTCTVEDKTVNGFTIRPDSTVTTAQWKAIAIIRQQI